MKIWPLPLLLLGGYGLLSKPAPSTKATLVIYGDVEGYLSPCGCTSPMTGGVQRMGTFVKELQSKTDTTFLVASGVVHSAGMQDQMKAECMAEIAATLKASAIGYSANEAALGPGAALEMAQLSGNILVASNVQSTPRLPLAQTIASGRFLISSIAHDPSRLAQHVGVAVEPTRQALQELLEVAQQSNLISVFDFDGTEEEARELARDFPAEDVILYRSTSDPPSKPVSVGNTLLVTPGFHGKDVVTLTFENGQETAYNVTALGPDFKNDPGVDLIYAEYLHRVNTSHLLDKLPRFKTEFYAGSQACRSCHAKAYSTWHSSAHSHAYADLTKQGHDLDPDCVSCHVVSLKSTNGFRSLAKTAQLANVGCESCHGPAESHALSPGRFRLPKVQPQTCVSCHTIENSPGFEFHAYWPKISH